MADNTVEIAQLRVMADYFLTAELPYFEELREAFKLLRLTGCRIQEIFEIERWTVISGYQVSVQPQKFNNIRYITLNSDFNNFLAAIQNQYKPFLGRTYSQLQFIFQKINPYGKLYSSTKEITNYFFRYLYVRELEFAGLTIQEIADIMGYTSTTAVNNYLNALLTSTIEVPVTPTDPLPPGHIDIITQTIVFNGNSDSFYIDFDPNIHFLTIFYEVEPVNTTDGILITNEVYGLNYYYPEISFKAVTNGCSVKGQMMRKNYTVLSGFLVTTYYSAGKKGIISFDYSVIGSSGELYRDIRTKFIHQGTVKYNNLNTNRYVQYPQSSRLLIGCRKSSTGVISLPIQATVFKLIIWRRLLTDEEIQSLWTL